MSDDWQGFTCICGDEVVVMHAECKSIYQEMKKEDMP